MISVAILLFPEVDLLDVGGPYEVFLTADRIAQRRGADSQFSVVTVSPDGEPVSSYGGMGLVPSAPVGSIEHADLIVIPGAIAIETVCATPEIRAAVATLIERSTIASSVCTGAFLLSDQQLLSDVPWTTHFEDVADLTARNGNNSGQAGVGWVDTGDVVTSGGLSNGISMALHMVDRLHSRELAVATARQIEYVWDPEAGITHAAGG